jgi:SAM-dependent methyltransferase
MEERPRPAVVKTFAKGKIRLFPTAGTKMTSPDENDYVLRGGDHGAERLRLLAAVKRPTTKPLLDRAGLRPGMRCLDMGCGAGAVTFRMAETVQPTGRVTGIDFDERCLQLARNEAQQLGLDVEFRTGRAADFRATFRRMSSDRDESGGRRPRLTTARRPCRTPETLDCSITSAVPI